MSGFVTIVEELRMQYLVTFFIVCFIICGCSKETETSPSKTKITRKIKIEKKQPDLKFKVTTGDVSCVGIVIRIQSMNNRPITIYSISQNRGEDYKSVRYPGGRLGNSGIRNLPMTINFGDIVYWPTSSSIIDSIIEVSIKTDQGIFVTQNIPRFKD